MNENINIAKILKDAPKGTKLWSPLCGVENWEWYGDALFPEHGTTLADIEDFTSDEKIIEDYL